MRVLISGASGMLGSALVRSLSVPSAFNGFKPEVFSLVRRAPRLASEIFWDPHEMRIDLKGLEGFDAVVHLAGENIGDGDGSLLGGLTGRWSELKKHRILESRRRGTQLLSQALASVRAKPRVLVAASGVGFYGSRGDAELAEDAPAGAGFLAEVSQVWEAKCAPAAAAGIRTVNLRFGVLLSRRGGALAKLYWPFFFGGGGPIGSGAQFMSWLALSDAVRVVEHAMRCEALAGAVNACAPAPARNADFVAALGAAMRRPALLPMPEAAVRLVFGEMGEETLLASQRALPTKLLASGFRFNHPDLAGALDEAIADTA